MRGRRGPLSLLATAIRLQQMQSDQVVWKLLRAKNAPAVIAILDTHLGGSDRRLPVPELINLVEADLEELRFRADMEFSRSAQAYCEQWRADGYLVRRPVAQARQETYELSAGAVSAISIAKRLIEPHRIATQSRLNTIINQINSLALAIDLNEESRRAFLIEERSRIDEQLKQLDEGTFEVLDGEKAVEQAYDILSLAREVPDDFVKVRDDFELINKSLHAKIVNFEDGHREVLEDIFSGVDQIGQSPSGRSFKGFYALLRDISLTESLQDNIDAILDSGFAEALSTDDRHFLRDLLNTFVEQGQEVNATMTAFARGLRRFVQNQDYQHDRRLKQELDQALGKSHALMDALPVNIRVGAALDLTSLGSAPISRMTLKNPAESLAAPAAGIEVIEAQTVTLEQLRQIARETEIDFQELLQNVGRCLAQARAGAGANAGAGQERLASVSVGAVLEQFPATQGLASVVGLVVLALEQGRAGDGFETVHWQARTGGWHHANIERWEFFRDVAL